MSAYTDLPPLAKIAEVLGGDAHRFDVRAPGPRHSSADRSMSVRPDENAPGGYLVHSFAGDDPIECKKYVAEKLGLKSKARGGGGGARNKPLGEYIYCTEDGAPYLRVQKFRDADGRKQFFQSRWDGNSWITGKPTGPKVPYRLPELIAASLGALVFFTEGEKSADRLAQLGFTATCVSEGAQAAWPSDAAKWFKDRHVIVLPDNDIVGAKHARKIAAGLQGVAASVRILDLAPHWPGEAMPKGHDVFDWIERHDTAGSRLAALAKEAPEASVAEATTATGVAIDGAAVLADLHAFLGRFVAYPSNHAHIAHTLWATHCHAMDSWDSTPRLAFLSPEPMSGKTRALEATELVTPNPVEAVNVSPAYLFRKIGNAEDGPPTILYDEIDTVFGPKAKDNEDIRAVLNAGHRRGAVAGRCATQGKNIVTEELPAFCAVALAGLGWLPDTLMSRSVVIRMRRRARAEKVEPFRRRDELDEGHDIRDRLAAWCVAKGPILTAMRPAMPAGIEDRDADVWEALLAVADAAGGTWPAAAREAAVVLVAAAKDREPSLNARLLSDLRVVFAALTAELGTEEVFTKELLDRLYALEEAPWQDIKGRPLNDRGLAYRLRQYGIGSKTLRRVGDSGEVKAKGYVRTDFPGRVGPLSSAPHPRHKRGKRGKRGKPGGRHACHG